jgi:hypothetical protein
VASNCFVLSSNHGSVLPCHGSVLLSLFWVVKLQLLLLLVTLGSVTIGCVQMPLGTEFKCAGCRIFLHCLLSQCRKVA